MVLELKGAELQTLINRDGRRSRVLEYLPDTKECINPDDESKHPWFIEWLAAQHSGKHVHTLRSPPGLDSIRYDLAMFLEKVKWRSKL